MKTQVAWSFSRSRTELQVTPQRGEALDIRSAEWLQSLNSELLLPLYYDPEKAHTNKLVLYYDITGHTALKRRLPRVWSLESYYAVLEGIERVCEECSSGTHLIERIIFDVEGEARAKLTVPDLLVLFREAAGRNLDNDRMMLS